MDDTTIVRLYWERNEEAIPATAKKYGRYCTAIARNILGNNEDAEECVNDTYLHAWNAIPPHKPAMLSAFLGKITRNLSLNKYNHNTAGKRGSGEMAAVLDELSEIVSGSDDPEQTYQNKELSRTIDAFLDTLSPEKRSIFVCRYWYTDSIAEIAVRHRMKEGAVSMALSRMRQKLRDYLTDGGYEL